MKIDAACLGPLGTNAYIVEAAGETILIDPAENSQALRDFVGSRTLDAVVNTHGHFDHTGGVNAYPEIPLRIHDADLPFLDASIKERPGGIVKLEDGDTIAGLRVMSVPGHSPGSVIFIGEDVLIVGDLLFAGSIGRTDLPGGSMGQILESLDRIIRLPGDYTVFPGHGPKTTLERERETNPFLVGLVKR